MTNVPDPENAIAEKLEGRTIYIFPFLYKHVHAPPPPASSRVYETRLSSRQSWATNGTRGTCYVDYVEIFLEHRQSSLIKRRIIVSLPLGYITFPSDFRIIRKTYVQSFKKNRLPRFGWKGK